MTDTAQGQGPAETVVASDPIADAAEAFKNFGKTPTPPRDEAGRFARAEQTAEEEVEEEGEALELDDLDEAEPHEEVEEAAEEAQPVNLPHSWPADMAETWNSLPPETQQFITEREGQRDAAVNAKFQEAANIKKANQALIDEAAANRQRFAEWAEIAMSAVQPQKPPLSMLDPNSGDYNPNHYHLLNARYEQEKEWVSSLQQQRNQVLAQQRQELEAAEREAIAAIEAKARPELLKHVPDLADQTKVNSALEEIVRYAIDSGIPQEVFSDPDRAGFVTSAELLLAWKAKQYDKMVQAKGKVKPKAASPASPTVKPGVTPTKSSLQARQRKANWERLDRERSIEAGAAFFKNL